MVAENLSFSLKYILEYRFWWCKLLAPMIKEIKHMPHNQANQTYFFSESSDYPSAEKEKKIKKKKKILMQ